MLYIIITYTTNMPNIPTSPITINPINIHLTRKYTKECKFTGDTAHIYLSDDDENKYKITVRMEEKGKIPPSGMTVSSDTFKRTNASAIYVKQNSETVGMVCVKFHDDYTEWFTEEEMQRFFVRA